MISGVVLKIPTEKKRNDAQTKFNEAVAEVRNIRMPKSKRSATKRILKSKINRTFKALKNVVSIYSATAAEKFSLVCTSSKGPDGTQQFSFSYPPNALPNTSASSEIAMLKVSKGDGAITFTPSGRPRARLDAVMKMDGKESADEWNNLGLDNMVHLKYSLNETFRTIQRNVESTIAGGVTDFLRQKIEDIAKAAGIKIEKAWPSLGLPEAVLTYHTKFNSEERFLECRSQNLEIIGHVDVKGIKITLNSPPSEVRSEQRAIGRERMMSDVLFHLENAKMFKHSDMKGVISYIQEAFESKKPMV